MKTRYSLFASFTDCKLNISLCLEQCKANTHFAFAIFPCPSSSSHPPASRSVFPPNFTRLPSPSLHLREAKLSALESSSCMCRTPCNMTRYNKELSMVKIPSKTSARYLQKKFNKSEKYITWVDSFSQGFTLTGIIKLVKSFVMCSCPWMSKKYN